MLQYTIRGVWDAAHAYPYPSRSRKPGRKLSTRTSEVPRRRSRTGRAPGSCRSRVIERLLRLSARKVGLSPPQKGGPHWRASSPPTGCSTFTTSAPSSARIIVAKGPATLRASSRTRTPRSGRSDARSPSAATLRLPSGPRDEVGDEPGHVGHVLQGPDERHRPVDLRPAQHPGGAVPELAGELGGPERSLGRAPRSLHTRRELRPIARPDPHLHVPAFDHVRLDRDRGVLHHGDAVHELPHLRPGHRVVREGGQGEAAVPEGGGHRVLHAELPLQSRAGPPG